LSQSSEQPPGKGLAPRRYPENPDGNGVWPGEVLHGDHQLMRPARFAAPPLKYTREGLRKDHLQQLARSSSWRAALNWRARKHA